MKKFIISAIMLLSISIAVNAMSFSGKWEGTLDLGQAQLRVVFNIHELQDGTLSATLDSPDQGATGIPCEATRLPGYYKIEIKVPSINACYNGAIDESRGNTIVGTFSQNGFELPLELGCVEHDTGGVVTYIKPKKPEELRVIDGDSTKIKPCEEWKGSYEFQEVKFGHDGVTLAGTLYMPSGSGGNGFPAAIIVSGSGTQDRDGAMMGLKPYASIAHYLHSRGVAVLCYDDRGAGESSPLEGCETTIDFARDAQAAFDFLTTVDGIDHTRIGYIGHSEGGQIAFINAASDKRVAFVVSLAGPAASGRDVMIQQNLSLLEMQGVPYTSTQVDEITAIFDDIVNIGDTTELCESLRKRFASSTLQRYTNEQIEQGVAIMTSPWYMTSIRFNPKPYLEKITCPVFALNGEWDFQVNADQTFDALKANVKNVRCELLPQHNHMFQKCASKLESFNYATQGDISWTTLGLIEDFIKGIYPEK
ncbi:MAG: alpha/beta fold hydrolase [Muribaculaceae bacterium]|nr:alpha/beta fold hydrolase [Muribaculaceae bacterium]